MSLESNAWRRVKRALTDGEFHPIRVERPIIPGTPDVNIVQGWIELKSEDEWPKRPQTIVKLKHPMTVEQRLFHRMRQSAGGKSWVLLKIGRDWLLFDGRVAADVLGSNNREGLIKAALHYWPGGLRDKELRKALRD